MIDRELMHRVLGAVASRQEADRFRGQILEIERENESVNDDFLRMAKTNQRLLDRLSRLKSVKAQFERDEIDDGDAFEALCSILEEPFACPECGLVQGHTRICRRREPGAEPEPVR